MYIDQYCNPLSDISFRDIQAQIHSIVELVCKTLRGVNSRHPSLTFRAGMELLEMGWAAGPWGDRQSAKPLRFHPQLGGT